MSPPTCTGHASHSCTTIVLTYDEYPGAGLFQRFPVINDPIPSGAFSCANATLGYRRQKPISFNNGLAAAIRST
jgi:hypothetical protein